MMPVKSHIPSAKGQVSRRDPAVRELALAWRDLTGGRVRGRDGCRRTVLACSGGGDSCGLVAGLAAGAPGARWLFVVAHIVHDMRPREEALADRDAASQLAEHLGLRFIERSISVREIGGNLESTARRLRYEALAEIAGECHCGYIATAHHAQDQFETLLMALVRGAGPRGLRGIARSRRLATSSGGRVRLIRPALGLETGTLRRLGEALGIQWREDATNLDTRRLRAAIRHGIVPHLEAIRPGASVRGAGAARLIAASERVLEDRIRALVERGLQAGEGRAFTWERNVLRSERGVVIAGVLRAVAARLLAGRGQDRLGWRRLEPMVRAIRDQSTEPRRFELGSRSAAAAGAPVAAEVTVTSGGVEVRCLE